MASKAWKTRFQHLIEVIIAHQSTQQPEGIHLSAVIEQDTSNEIHSLDIPYWTIVITECYQYSLDGLFIIILIKICWFNESPLQIHFNIINDLFELGFWFLTVLIQIRSIFCIIDFKLILIYNCIFQPSGWSAAAFWILRWKSNELGESVTLAAVARQYLKNLSFIFVFWSFILNLV